MATRVAAYPRLHFGLLDCADVSGRVFGGVGVAVDALPAIVACKPVRGSRSQVSSVVAVDAEALSDVESAIARLAQFTDSGDGVSLVIERMPPQHVGLGSKTALILASLKSASLAAFAGVRDADLRYLSRRGGASGIGLHGFFHGGLLADGGHKTGQALSPSAAATDFVPPPLLVRLDFPVDWRIWLLLPCDGVRYFGGTEIAMFRENLPIPEGEALETVAVAYHGVVAQVAVRDLEGLALGLSRLQSTGFKRVEIASQSPGVRGLLNALKAEGVANGMSSLGPLVFAFSGPEADHEAAIRDATYAWDAELLAVTVARNTGYEVLA